MLKNSSERNHGQQLNMFLRSATNHWIGILRPFSIPVMKAIASSTVGLITMSSHTHVGMPSSGPTTLWPAAERGVAYSTSGCSCHSCVKCQVKSVDCTPSRCFW